MALSLLQDAQTARGIAAVRALTGMKHDDDRSASISPPMTSSATSSLYPNLLPSAAASAMGMQFLAANQAAFLAAGLPMSLRTLATTGLFPPMGHPALFNAWRTHPPSSCNSPPRSPMSPAYSESDRAKLTNNNHIVSTTSDILAKKAAKRKAPTVKREIGIKKELLSPSGTDLDLLGPISPPNSGSSPNSTGSSEPPPVASTTKDPTRDKVFTCKICNRSFGYKHVLQNHERTHTGEKPFQCPQCEKRFTRDHHLKTHMRLHTGEKPYSCTHCDRKFVQVANLRRHLRVHTGERPYTCEICNARFSDSNQLKSHTLVHNGEKPFECERCGSRFRRRHHVLHHKCEPNAMSPPTPALSPTMSLSDHKSEISDESLDLSKHKLPPFPLPLRHDEMEASRRKSAEIRRVLRTPLQIPHVQTSLPVQTEPEDLSMHSPRSSVSIEELDELDDAVSLNMKHTQFKMSPPSNL